MTSMDFQLLLDMQKRTYSNYICDERRYSMIYIFFNDKNVTDADIRYRYCDVTALSEDL